MINRTVIPAKAGTQSTGRAWSRDAFLDTGPGRCDEQMETGK
jgi:hypothetical protein